MSNIGTVGWFDLTVPNADEVRDFYSAVVGWKAEPVSMGDYNDYNMTKDGTPVTGVCHKRGTNAELPSQWLIYITVENLDESINQCKKFGGQVISGPKKMGDTARYCVIKDPAGAVCGLFEQKTDQA